MIKLVKKNGLGGIADAVDNSLNGLGTWGKLGVLVVDPTGVTGWKDFGEALKVFQKEGTLRKAGELSLAGLGVIPMFGVFKSLPRLLGLSKKAGKAGDAAKLIKKVLDLPKGMDVAAYKKILDPNFDSTALIRSLDTEDLQKLKACVEYSATQYMKLAGEHAATPELAARALKYEQLLTDIDKNIMDKGLDELYKEGDGILATTSHAFDVKDGVPVKGERTYNLGTKEGRENAAKAEKAKRSFLKENDEIYFS